MLIDNIKRSAHLETSVQMVVGLIIGYIILRVFGLTSTESVALQSVIFITSYIRSYTIRRIFAKLNKQ